MPCSAFLADWPFQKHHSTNSRKFVSHLAGYSRFIKSFRIVLPRGPYTPKPWNLRPPGQHRSVVMGQGESRSHMDIPSSGMVGDSGPHLDKTLDQPVDGSLHFFTPDIELPDHVQEVVGQNPHLQPGLVGLETLATGLVPAQGVLALFDPVFDLCPAIIDLDHFTSMQP